jgi:hypothetical protein
VVAGTNAFAPPVPRVTVIERNRARPVPETVANRWTVAGDPGEVTVANRVTDSPGASTGRLNIVPVLVETETGSWTKPPTSLEARAPATPHMARAPNPAETAADRARRRTESAAPLSSANGCSQVMSVSLYLSFGRRPPGTR